MKKLETLKTAAKKITAADLEKIVGCPDVPTDSLSANETFAVMLYTELAKALKATDSVLVMDCNYAQSKFHAAETYLVDYWRIVSTDTRNQSMIQIYVHANAKRGTASFHLCTSCARVNRDQFEALEDELHFTVKRDTKTGRAKTTERKGIGYEELPAVVKAVKAVLANTAKAKADAQTNDETGAE